MMDKRFRFRFGGFALFENKVRQKKIPVIYYLYYHYHTDENIVDYCSQKHSHITVILRGKGEAHTTARRDRGTNWPFDEDKVYTCYVVLVTLNHRTSWATAIPMMRCDVGLHNEALLWPGGIAGGRLLLVLASTEELYEEYFVEAPREMTTMGRVVAYERWVQWQQECLMGMKNIDFEF